MRVSIRGIQQAQKANARMIAEMQPSGAAGRMIQTVLAGLHRYAVSVTHVDTGALRASHRMGLEHGFFGGLRGRIFIDPAAIGNKGKRPAVYGTFEHARGGHHAFYERTYNEAGARAVKAGITTLLRGLPR